MAPQVKIELIGPEEAQDYLDRNSRNRALSANRVGGYAAAMLRGEWLLNGETLKFNGDGTLLDGQHRLAAVVKSGTNQRFMVVRGLSTEVQDTVDAGRARTFSDILKIRGEAYNTALAAAVRIAHAYEHTGIPVHTSAAVVSNQQLIACLGRHPGIRESLSTGGHHNAILLLSRSMVTGLHYLFASADRDDADAFFSLLDTGEALEKSDPIFSLRDRMIREMRDHKRMKSIVLTAFTVRAFNAWRNGERMTKYQWKPGGARPDRFPPIEGCTIPILAAQDEAA